MGGGGAMRAAAKVAGITVANGGLRGVQAAASLPAAEHSASSAARKATRPVSAIVSSSDEAKSSGGLLAVSSNNAIDAGVQRPCWELEEWEFAGGDEEVMVKSGEPMPRLVFGVVPTLQEARDATSELTDALEKAFLASPDSIGYGDSYISGHESASLLLSKPEFLETKACVTSETTAVSLPKNALKAFRLLNESPAAQNVVASIASDPNVWHAVLQNKALTEFLESQKSTASFSEMDPVMEKSVADTECLKDHESPKSVDGSSDSGKSADSGKGFMGFMDGIKTQVVDMWSSLSDYFQSLFGGSTAEKVPTDADGNAQSTSVDKVLGASFMGLAVMVIMVVVLKRG